VEARQAFQIINGFCSLLFLYYASIQIPLAGIMISALMPFPTIIVGHRCGLGSALVVAATALGVILGLEQVWGIKAEILPFAEMALIGLLLVFLDQRNCRVETVIGFTVLIILLMGSAVFFGQGLKQGLSPQVFLSKTTQDYLDNLMTFLQREGLSLKDLLPEELSLSQFKRLLMQISPALFAMNATVVVWLNLIISRHILRQTGNREVKAPLNRWEAPGWLVFIFIGAGFMLFLPDKWLPGIGLNILLLCGLIYFLQGLAVVSFTFQRYQVPLFVRLMSYPLLVFLKPVILMVLLLGLIDLWVDFRQINKPPAEVRE
jgi:uncharacterized protein YybS (DUF2232 family)